MAYGHWLKMMRIQQGLPGARAGGFGNGGPMINPRAPGYRAGLMFGRARGMGRYQGDPGLFGGILKAVGKVAGAALSLTPVGRVASTVFNALNAPTRVGAPASRAAPVFPGMGGLNMQGGGPDQDKPGPVVLGTAAGTPGMSLAKCGASGYHLNRSGYWRNESDLLPGASWQEPGTVCVKNRRMNPFNPRAASAAMRRIAALTRGTKVMMKQLAKVARGAGVSSTRGRACGCGPKRKRS